MNPTYDSTGKVALVTSASADIGLARAKAFGEAGAAVVLVCIAERSLLLATDSLLTAGHRATATPRSDP
jgi:NAD(P)-dependent dehydrogenase (short-subunit alcohol dehydrogenase family)